MVRRVRYTAIRFKKYMRNIQAELDARKLEYAGKENVSALVELLRNNETGDNTECFEPLTEVLHIIVEETDE